MNVSLGGEVIMGSILLDRMEAKGLAKGIAKGITERVLSLQNVNVDFRRQ